jgi:hypothetical protein
LSETQQMQRPEGIGRWPRNEEPPARPLGWLAENQIHKHFDKLSQIRATVIDPQTKAAYVLLRKEAYERLQHILDGDDARLMAPLLADLDPEDWEDAAAYEGTP